MNPFDIPFTFAAAILSALLPGLHANNSVSWLPIFSDPSFAGVLLVALLCGFYAAFELFKTLFLGVADAEGIGPAFAGPKLVEMGESSRAIGSAAVGLVVGALTAIPLAWWIGTVGKANTVFFQNIFPLAVVIALVLIFSSMPKKKWLSSLFIVGAASLMGLASLRHPLIGNPLSCLIIGFFGVPILLEPIAWPATFFVKPFLIRFSHLMEGIKGSVAAMWMVLFPAVGPSFSAAISSLFFSSPRDLEGQVSRMSALSMANTVGGFWGIYYLGVTRNGTAVAVSEVWNFTFMELFFFSGVLIGSLSIGLFLFWKLHPTLITFFELVPQRPLRFMLLLVLAGLVLNHSGEMGLVATAGAACVSLLGKKESVRPALLMSFLAIPLLVSIY